jgi:hypothetical protein
MARKIADGSAFGTKYEVFVRAGTVDSTDTRSETETTGSISGGGGMTVGGTGANAPVSGQIESKTTRYQNIYLTDEDGREHPVELVDFLVPCREGQKLSLMFVKTGGKELGSYFHAYNHNTSKHYDHGAALRSEMFPIRILIAAVLIVALVTWKSISGSPGNDGFEVMAGTFIVTGLIGVVLYGIAKVIAGVRGARLRANPAFKQFLAELSR